MKPTNVPTIPLNAAIARVKRFRERMIDAAAVEDTSIPRAVLIPIDDLMAIVKKYTATNENGESFVTLQGVRAYFDIKFTDRELPDPVTALIVPVDLKGNDIIYTPQGLGDSEETEIYDFTKPCPSQCDPESPLFVE